MRAGKENPGCDFGMFIPRLLGLWQLLGALGVCVGVGGRQGVCVYVASLQHRNKSANFV